MAAVSRQELCRVGDGQPVGVLYSKSIKNILLSLQLRDVQVVQSYLEVDNRRRSLPREAVRGCRQNFLVQCLPSMHEETRSVGLCL